MTLKVLGLTAVVWGIVVCSFARVARAGEEDRPAIRRGELVAQLGHLDRVDAVAFSPDGAHVLTGSWDGAAILWETETGREVRRFKGHADHVESVAFSPDGARVLTGSLDGSARLWNTATGEEIVRLHGEEMFVHSVAFSPDGRFILLGLTDQSSIIESALTGEEPQDAIALLWDTVTERGVRTFEGGESFVKAVAYSPDGRHLITGTGDSVARLWETETGREVRQLAGHGEQVCTAAFSADGKHVVTGSWDGTARLWEIATGNEVRKFEVPGSKILSVALSSDGTRLLTGSKDRAARLWNVATGTEVRRLEGHEAAVTSVALSPDGTYALTGSGDASPRLWSTATGRTIRRFVGSGSNVYSVAFSPDGRLMATGSEDGIARLWECATGAEIRRLVGHRGQVRSIAFSPDGSHVLTASEDFTARLWEGATGKEVRRFVGHRLWVGSAAFSPDGVHVLTGSYDGTARLWETATGKEVHRLGGYADEVTSVAFSPDGAYVLTTSIGDPAILWETTTGEQVRRLSPDRMALGGVHAVAFSPDGQLVLGGVGNSAACLWETSTGKEVRQFRDHPDRSSGDHAAAVSFSPDGSHIVMGLESGDLQLWETATGRLVHRLDGHGAVVTSIGFSPSGAHLLTGSKDKTARLWDAASAKQLCYLASFRNDTWAVVAPDGRFDTNNLEEIEGLRWVMPDDPMRTLPIEIFMRDYYEPRLLPRLVAGEAMRPVKDLTTLNRAQSHVGLVSVEPDPEETGAVRVTVEVGSRSVRSGPRGDEKVSRSGVRDLRLFRDGQIVAWRDGDLGDSAGDVRITLSGIRVPTPAKATEVIFSAYAFNVDGVKSRTDRLSYRVEPAADTRKGVAYLIAFGVDAFAAPRWNLSYAADDARLHLESLGKALLATNAWARVVPLLLTSEEGHDLARRDDLRAALVALAGEDIGAAAKRRVPALQRFEKARPEDLVILAVSTHGQATGDGGFLVLPSDAVFGEDGEVVHESCISTKDLKQWLRPVDAGEMVMIVDACQSAASVEQEGFKPGPMGSRGFGQLAWNKKMRILAASQASEYALESSKLRHGLLTHALVREGLDAGRADMAEPSDGAITLREWLEYGESRVPALAEAIATGSIGAMGPKGPLDKRNRPVASRVVQRPALFDFARPGRSVILKAR